MSAPKHIDATFYAQVEPVWASWDRSRLTGAKVITTTQKKPDKPKGGTVLVKLTIRVPEAAFLPLRPEAIVVIPDDLAQTNPVEVIAEDPE